VDAEGRPYYAMRLIRGETLQEAVARFRGPGGPAAAPGERALALRGLLGRFVAVCNAVAYAHSRGVVHRDLKPANVMLGPYGETLVVDWGLAKALGERPDSSGAAEDTLRPGLAGPGLTQAGAVVGTPAYMSPEQAAGRHAEVGPASDVYGLGATLYALLTGRAPFEGRDALDVLARVVEGGPVPPRRVNPAVPPALEAVCLRAMTPRREGRYATALELAEEVERWLADEPVRAHREPLPARLRRWGRRHRPLVTASAAALVVALAALGLAAGLLARANQRERDARAAAEEAEAQANLDREEADRQRGLAETSARATREQYYVSQINLAQQTWEQGQVGRTRELLVGLLPEQGKPDLRGFEWHYLWRLCQRAEPHTLRGHTMGVSSLAFAPDGKVLATGSEDGTAVVWDVAGRRPLRALVPAPEDRDGELGLRWGCAGASRAASWSSRRCWTAVRPGATGGCGAGTGWPASPGRAGRWSRRRG
jgi:hypothetical protein